MLIAIATATICMAPCCDDDDTGNTFQFTNRSDIDVQVCYLFKNKVLADNSIVNSIEGYEHGSYNNRQMKAHSYIKDANITQSVFDELTTQYSTLSVYVLSGASTVSERNIICRYDLTADDWSLCCSLQFPPSPRMAKLHMEPSYEELTQWAPSIHDLVTDEVITSNN